MMARVPARRWRIGMADELRDARRAADGCAGLAAVGAVFISVARTIEHPLVDVEAWHAWHREEEVVGHHLRRGLGGDAAVALLEAEQRKHCALVRGVEWSEVRRERAEALVRFRFPTTASASMGTWASDPRCETMKEERARTATRKATIASLGVKGPREDPEDGSLVGWRGWDLVGYGDRVKLMSPTRRLVWEGPMLRATGTILGGSVRNHEGVHACWDGEGVAREGYHVQPVIGEVRGFGRFVSGPEGWRAEEVVVVRLIIAHSWRADAAAVLAARYGVPVDVLE